MKKRFALLAVLLLLCLTFTTLASSALAETFPIYAACAGERVNVRKNPASKTPSLGRLIHNAPIIVTGESSDGTCWYCSTYYGEGYVPKQYVQLFEDMTYEEYRDYCSEHPNTYRTLAQLTNKELLERYYNGKISQEELKTYWHKNPRTGYYGWYFDKHGNVVFTRPRPPRRHRR